MDQIQLQQKIAEYFAKLPKEAQDVFSSMTWMETLKSIGKEYNLNEKQMELLGTETTLVLLGITHVEEYEKIIETQLGLTEENIKKVTLEISNNILSTIKDQLTAVFESNALSLFEANLDSNFADLPKNVQIAIANSNWKEKLYEIAGKYKLTVSQMAILEEVTIKVMKNEITPDKYEGELASKLAIQKEDVSNLVNDINTNILVSIRELMKVDIKIEQKKIIEKEEIPLPPYMKTAPPAQTEEKVTPKNTVEIKEKIKITETPKQAEVIKEIINNSGNIPNLPTPPKNPVEDKLKGTTVSEHSVSDYSTPKVSDPTTANPLPRSYDPYREAF